MEDFRKPVKALQAQDDVQSSMQQVSTEMFASGKTGLEKGKKILSAKHTLETKGNQ